MDPAFKCARHCMLSLHLQTVNAITRRCAAGALCRLLGMPCHSDCCRCTAMQETFADEGLSYSMGGKTGSTLVSAGHISSSCVSGRSWMVLTIMTHQATYMIT
jgi:hypothetical protein